MGNVLSHSFSWECANQMAQMSRDAYLEPKEFKKKWKRAKFIEGDGTQCYIWRPPKDKQAGVWHKIVVVFRGTEPNEFEDIKSDLQFKKTASEGAGSVHYGFKDALDDVWDKVSKELKPDDDIYFTGHSLGAALATLAAGRVNTEKVHLYTFGSPKCVNGIWGQDKVFREKTYRFRNNNDLITKVPFFGYKHFGKMYYFNSNNEFVDKFNKWYLLGQWFKGTAKGLKQLKWDSFSDHSMNHYCSLIESKLDGNTDGIGEGKGETA